MSKSANAGELRTPVRFCKITRVPNSKGIPEKREENVFGGNKTVMCKWVNAHGSESFTAMQLQINEPATLTCRYSPKITPDLIAYKGDDKSPYDVISVDNVEERGRWLEIKVKRREAAR